MNQKSLEPTSPQYDSNSIAASLIVALDVSESQWDEWIDLLKGRVRGVKIGLEAFTRGGREIVKRCIDNDLPVFLDLKLHDIPNTVFRAAQAAAQLGVWLFTVHTAGGEEMLKKAVEGAQKGAQGSAKRPKVLGVTVLTSQESNPDEILKRAQVAQKAGCDGVVCSALEVQSLRKKLGKNFEIVTPGIRFQNENSKDDQKRIATPKDALAWGANWLVMGRPILNASDPKKLLLELGKA